jgi:hypothetical protein
MDAARPELVRISRLGPLSETTPLDRSPGGDPVRLLALALRSAIAIDSTVEHLNPDDEFERRELTRLKTLDKALWAFISAERE